jgi:hypothetical protein
VLVARWADDHDHDLVVVLAAEHPVPAAFTVGLLTPALLASAPAA